MTGATEEFHDYPIDECVATVYDLIQRGKVMLFHQKWTCAHCGTRQTMEVPNKFFTSGLCEECGKSTTITSCNYLVVGSPDLISEL